MPLDRDHVTVGSRIMLPTYPLFIGGVGLSLTFTPIDRLLETPAFAYAADLAPLRLWGAGFLAVAAILIIALLAHRRAAYLAGAAVMVTWMAGWTGLLVLSAIKGESSYSAWMWPAFVAVAGYATMSSLLAREV
ncbi:MAG: hypothetical protein HOV78_11610 [Hamadaea sp.]|nr:hypothetical protein [Hamadaea sp.]